jgi:putative serine protease PepD
VKAVGQRISGTRLLAAVVLSACVGLVGGGLGAWGVYTHFGPVQRVVTETKTGGSGISVGDIAATAQSSLVTVSTAAVTPGALAAGSRSGLAAGFAVTADGLVVTSAAAVRGASRLRVATADGRSFDATVAASDIADGVVVLRAAGATGMTPMHIATQDARIGDVAVAVFHPALGTLTTRSGVVAATGVSASDGGNDLADLITVDSTSAPQAEGAPLVDGTGAVIGVVTGVSSLPGVTAASGRHVATLLSAISRGSAVTTPTFGVSSLFVDAALAAATGLHQGALIRSVSPTGPAAGVLAAGDVVISVNGTAVSAAKSIEPSDFGLLAGDRAALQVVGPDGSVRTATVVVAAG